MLTKAALGERGTRARAFEFEAGSGQRDSIIFSPGDGGKHAIRLQAQELHRSAAVIILAAGEHLLSSKLMQRVDVEARGSRGRRTCSFHTGGLSTPSDSSAAKASSSVSEK